MILIDHPEDTQQGPLSSTTKEIIWKYNHSTLSLVSVRSLKLKMLIVNFDYLEDILNKSLIDQLMINPKETPLIFTEPALHNKETRLKLTEFLFEKYQVPAIFIGKAPVLASFSCGRSTAIVIDSGYKQTFATPVHDGYALQKCIIKHDIGGY